MASISNRLAGLAVFVAGAYAHAGGLMVSPVVVDATIKKSGDTLPPIKVTNNGSDPLDISISFTSLGHDATGQPTEAPAGYKWDAEKMLSSKVASFKLQPNQSQDVTLQVTIPAGMSGGGYATLFILGKPPQKTQSTIATYIRVGVLVELTLPGDAKHALAGGKIYAAQDTPGGAVTFFAGIQNQGEVHEKVGGNVVVLDSTGKQVATVPLDPANVFPSLSRNIKGTWQAPKTLPKGSYKLTATLDSPTVKGSFSDLGTFDVVNPGELAQDRATVNKLPTPPVVQNKPIAIEAAITNTGNVPFTPAGTISFVNVQGQTVATLPLAASGPIQPKGKGSLKGSLDKGIPTGSYTARLDVSGEAGQAIAQFSSTQQVIDKEVNMTGKIATLLGPNPKDKFVTVEFSNDGNVELDATGMVSVVDANGNEVGQIQLEKQHVTIGSKASYKRGLPDGLDPGLYELRATIYYGGANAATKSLKVNVGG